jgi:hypothetical protein
MANLSRRTRRHRALGISTLVSRAWGRRKFLGIGNRATLTTSLAGSNNDLTLIARAPGTAANSIRLRIVVAGVSTPLSVSVSGNDITVNSATNGASAATSTANDVVRALLASTAATALVWSQVAPANDGTGVVAALAFTNLSGAS